ncbi:MAG: 4Fe-4S dicluster domain-containing protein [Alcaligenaceae bacterium]|nr:4Fe-4S dicluster domain-containing protein [Alcaligenaceae bacterium]
MRSNTKIENTGTASGKRKFLKNMLGLSAAATVIPIIPAEAAINEQPPRRPGIPGKRYAMFIDLRKCIGCQACTVGCSMENLPPIGQFRTNVLQYEVEKYDDGLPAMFNLPRLCNHCDNPPCIPVCPVQATFQREDGVVLIDNERCVGCGYCVQACPYDARFINKETQTADKCTFCEHRLEAGLLPACVETCVGGARLIGDLNDPDSEINSLLEEHKGEVKVLKPDMAASPHVFYLGLPDEFVDGIDGQASVRLVRTL